MGRWYQFFLDNPREGFTLIQLLEFAEQRKELVGYLAESCANLLVDGGYLIKIPDNTTKKTINIYKLSPKDPGPIQESNSVNYLGLKPDAF
ncbi:hypothetical protein A3K63_01780 [Candidatus Micrarchaeota archaeon RBG_16_49_10]|nr:MAG: hypothetical protein A3K63_01780 [Candidatus Micrarchaeota archaeon RBG_16_49_10]